MKSDLMEALQMLKFLRNNNYGLNFTAGFGWQAELQELEDFNLIDSIVSEDLMAFQHDFTFPMEGNSSHDQF